MKRMRMSAHFDYATGEDITAKKKEMRTHLFFVFLF